MSPLAHILPNLHAERAAVLGAGVSGRGAAALLRSQGAWVTLFDEKGGDNVDDEFTEADARRYKVVVYSPGFKPDHPWLALARAAGAQLYGELDFASLYWPGALVAVTGTNGKTTLTEFLVHALERAGADAFAAGNVGFPLSRFFENGGADHTVAVCEVSSFQAEDMRAFHPQAVIWTNFAEDHLERHGSMHDYFAAKFRLVEQLHRPRLFVGPSVAYWAQELGFALPAYTKVVDETKANAPQGSPFLQPPQRENFALARAYWEAEHMDGQLLEQAARSFKLPEHRLQLIAEIDGLRCWDDSKATNFHAAEAALLAMEGPVLWIGGGRRKGGDIAGFARRISRRIDRAFVIGEAALELKSAFKQDGVETILLPDLPTAVAEAWKHRPAQGNLLLSPGFSSHDQFSTYAERGDCFKRAVLSLMGAQGPSTVSTCVKP